jgi:hypothetical protein
MHGTAFPGYQELIGKLSDASITRAATVSKLPQCAWMPWHAFDIHTDNRTTHTIEQQADADDDKDKLSL